MSGICGFWNLDGSRASGEDLSGMLTQLERRGPDGTERHATGSVALGHTMLATTPEALHEKLPLVHRETGCAITADLRLDNRAELSEKLALRSKAPAHGDSEIVLLAYLKWGDACLDHLRGDFAFAIWDPRSQSLLCARDQVGMRQLIYHHRPGTLFAFASEAQALIRHRDIPDRLNEARIGDFLDDLEAIDLTSTFYSELFQLPPAHAIRVTKSALKQWRYWEITKQPRLSLRSDEDYAEAFREVFTRAVEPRLRTVEPIGSMLSGGMDSSAVSAVAASLLERDGRPPLKTFSAIRDDPDCVESNAIRAAMEIAHIEPNTARLEDIDSMRRPLLGALEELGEPFDGSMDIIRAIYLKAQQAGCKVVLDGVGGDTTLGVDNVLDRHLRRGQLVSAWKQAQGERHYWGPQSNPIMAMLQGAKRVYTPDWARSLRQALRGPPTKRIGGPDSQIEPGFAKRVALTARRQQYDEHVSFRKHAHGLKRARHMLHPYISVARERYDRVAGQFAIEPRDPFLDLSLLEFCLSLPVEQLEHKGWPKIVLRRAMRGLVPDAVCWRVGKEHLGWEFTKGLANELIEKTRPAIESGLRPYVAAAGIETLTSPELRKNPDTKVDAALTLCYLALWLQCSKCNSVTGDHHVEAEC